MLNPFSMIFFVLVMAWTGSIFLTSNSEARIERACSPVTISDKVVVAAVQLMHEPWALDAHKMMLGAEYSCRFAVWKVFYEDALEHGAYTQGPADFPKLSAPKVPLLAPPVHMKRADPEQPTARAQEQETVEIKVPNQSTDATPKPLPSYLDTK